VPRDLEVRYPPQRAVSRIRIAPGALRRLGSFVSHTVPASRVALITDAQVAALHGPAALASLRGARLAAEMIVVPRGERSKSVRQLARLWDALGTLGLDRSGVVVALGGGVVGDLAGFAAASWLRGVPWICVPTTLLAQVDSSVGGKTGIDLPAGKNLAGAFHQPAGVLVDADVLGTLPPRQVRAGLAEVVKMGMAVDGALFRFAETHAADLALRRPEALEEVVRRSIAAKLAVVRRDPHERPGGGRAALNYGHTLGHALEATLGYRRLLHGEAVAIGMAVAGALSVRGAGLAERDRARQDALLERLGLPRRIPGVSLAALLARIQRDKKGRAGAARWVLTTRMGHASVPRSIPGRLVEAALLDAGARP
jgi:3-dehydroquinate synthase